MDEGLTRQRGVLGLVEQALAQPEADRGAWLAVHCAAQDLAVAQRLLALAESCDTALSHESAAPLAPIPLDSQQGQVFGAYRLVDIVGQGGMGVVYRAQRVDGAYDDQVAVKLISFANPTSAQVSRFERERQLLSDLRHPNVAALLDGGTSDLGIPYVVMQYVDGVPIDDYCQHGELSLTERLRLFETVCRAVQAAHQRFVIHRDLKPENVLVDPSGFPRLIDFGIATTLDRESNAATRTQVLSLTPAYASPEQIRNEPLTAATDVYSLGVMLYELLAGERPYDVSAMSVLEAERMLSTYTASRPSVCEGTRRFPLSSLQRKELDAIVLRAIETDPQRRYATAGALADDLARFLRREPVSAQLDTGFYRARRFLSRHLGVSVAASVAALALVGGLVAALGQAERANRELARAEAVRQYLTDILLSPQPYVRDSLQQGEDATIADLLDAAAERLDNDLLHLPSVRADIYETLAHAQMWMNRPEAALRSAHKLLALTRAGANARVSVLDSLLLLAEVHEDKGEVDQAVAVYSEARALAQAQGERGWEVQRQLYNNLAVALAADGRFEQALEMQRKAESVTARHGAHGEWGIVTYANLGNYLFETGNTADALAAYETALRNADQAREYQFFARRTDWRLGAYYEFAGQTQLARRHYDRALALAELPYIDAETDVAMIGLMIARLDAADADHDAARQSIDAIGAAFADYLADPEAWPYFHAQTALALAESRWEDALQAADRAMMLADAWPPASQARKLLIRFEHALAVAGLRRQDPTRAPALAPTEQLMAKAYDGLARWAGPEHPLARAAAAQLQDLRGGVAAGVSSPTPTPPAGAAHAQHH